MKVIVTGGCGYIGSHVARAFKQHGDTVYIVDNVKREHTLKDIDGYLIDDFASDASLAMMYVLAPDIIVHCAGTSLVGPSITNPSVYYDNNISKTIKMLNMIKDMPKLPAIMFSSSASVYGEPTRLPIAESESIKPISPYGNTKAMTETILQDYATAYNIRSVCFRYFNAAGAEPFTSDLGQAPGATHIIARVLEASINDMPFTLNGSDYNTPDGSCIRDYIHVWDLAQAHIKGAEYLATIHVDSPRAMVFNLGTTQGISNWQIINYVIEQYGLNTLLVDERRPGDPAELVADADYAKQQLGWIPQYSTIETIVDSAYKWYTQNV